MIFLESFLAPYIIYLLLASALSLGVAVGFDKLFSPGPRTRVWLYAGTLFLPFVTYIRYLMHAAYTCRVNGTVTQALICVLAARYWLLLGTITSLLFSGYLLFRWHRLKAPGRSAAPWADPQAYARVRMLIGRLGLQREPGVFLLDTIYPLAYVKGYTRPVIYLSRGLLEILDDQELQAVLAHEAAHIVGGDNALNLALLFKELAFFSPFTHLAYARFSQAREEAADALAASRTGFHDALALAIIRVMKRTHGLKYCAQLRPAESYLVRPAGPVARVRRLLDDGARHRCRYMLLVPPVFGLTLGLLFVLC
ncbi:MAG: M56 family metallopeptidase [Bacillota bacterium]